MNRASSSRHSLARSQRGVALAFSMIMLLVLTVISIVSLRSSIFEGRMARNEETRISAFQRAQSTVDVTISDVDNMIVAGNVDDSSCRGDFFPVFPSTECNTANTLVWDAAFTIADDSSARVVRMAPDLAPPPPIIGATADLFQAAQFKVEGVYDGRAGQQGASGVAQGVMILVVVGAQ